LNAFRNIVAGAGLLMTVAGASSAQAAVISFSDTINITPTNWNLSVSLPKFDTALGPLNSILVEITGQISGNIRMESEDGAPATITGTLSAFQVLNKPGGGFLLNVLPSVNEVFNASAYDGTTDYGGTSGVTVLGATGSASASTFVAGGDFGLFTCTGVACATNLSMLINSTGTSSATGAGNIATLFNTDAGAEVTVTYDYGVSTPEPASMAILGAGMLALGIARRRRNRA
jgi:hypothetical protein